MSFVSAFLVFGAVALIGYNVYSYMHASGSIADRLSAAWKGSMTLFVGMVATIGSLFTAGLDGLASLTGDPIFSQWSEAVKTVIPAQWHPYIPIAGLTVTMLARLRTAGK